jgi:VCBS repeat-containing protein
MANLNGTNKADTIGGTAAADRIFGDNGNDIINGGAGDDYIDGGNGSDTLSGGAGNDEIDGGNGQDTLLLAGNRADYRFLDGPNGSVIVRDLRAGSPDGTDKLLNMERVEFKDGTFKLGDLISVNASPVARNDSLTLAENAGKTDVTATLLGNDSDADGDVLKIGSVQAVSAKGAIVTLGADGKVSYDSGSIFADLDDGETATDSFTYTITDGAGHTSTATATVKITGVTTEVPMPEPDAFFYVAEDGTNADEMFGAIVESFGFDIVGVDASHAKGTVVFDHDGGILSFTADDPGSDALQYDGHEDTWFTVYGDNGEKAVIGIVIEGNNDDIVAVDDSVAIGEGQTSSNLWSALIANEIDPDGGAPEREILGVGTAGTQGSVSFDAATRTVTYSAAGIDLAPGQTITDSFTYTVEDGWGSEDTATVFVTVTGAAGGAFAASMAPAGGESILAAFLPAGGGDTGLEGLGVAQPIEMLHPDLLLA